MNDALRLIGERLPGVAGVLRGMGFMVGEVTAAELATIPCDATRRGEMRRVEGAAGAADQFVLCEKDAADAYAWTVVTPLQVVHDPVTVADTASIDLTLTGQQVSAAAIFGSTATTIAAGNHTHAPTIPASGVGTFTVIDDFDFGVATSGSIGHGNWVFTNGAGTGSVAMHTLASESAHPGTVRISPGATANNFSYLSPAGNEYNYPLGLIDRLEVVFELVTGGANDTAWFGLANVFSEASIVDGLYLLGNNLQWDVVKVVGGVVTTTSNVAARAVGVWYHLSFVNSGGGTWEVRLNGVLEATLTGLSTAAFCAPLFVCRTTTASARAIDIDYALFQYTTTANRY